MFEGITELTALSPLDGRYEKKIDHIKDYFSEAALIKSYIALYFNNLTPF